ncbi:MAG TPA: WecB/TagA/CpsF family glycosyltransferase [Candidatus Eisenbacteria bacterium]|nr:WecB/TagA/CpsF family glycosyltransferase [Candidatus Eisenbacteria bacterium]
MIPTAKRNILGISVNATDYEAATAAIISAAHARKPCAVTALAVHGLMTGVRDEKHRFRLNSIDIVVPDGQPVRWALNWIHGAGLKDRVYGPNLTLEVCRSAELEGLSVFFFGATPDILTRLQSNLLRRFPRLKIAGAISSKFRRLTLSEKDQIVSEIRESGASIVFVGLGCPRQEIWIYEFRQWLDCPLMAVGAAFPFLAGTVKQAPAFMQRAGLEWLFRLSQEPLRLWRRYLFLNPLYLALLALQRTGMAEFSNYGEAPANLTLPG